MREIIKILTVTHTQQMSETPNKAIGSQQKWDSLPPHTKPLPLSAWYCEVECEWYRSTLLQYHQWENYLFLNCYDSYSWSTSEFPLIQVYPCHIKKKKRIHKKNCRLPNWGVSKPVEAICCVVWWCNSVTPLFCPNGGLKSTKCFFNYIFLNTDEYLVITEQIIKMWKC